MNAARKNPMMTNTTPSNMSLKPTGTLIIIGSYHAAGWLRNVQ